MPGRVADQVDRLRQVDDHEPVAGGEHVVGRQVAVDQPVPGQLGQDVAQLVEVRRQQRAVRPGLGQPGSGLAVDGDPLHEQLGPVELHGVGDRQAELVAAHQRLPLRPGPLAGGDRPAEGGLLGHGAGVAGVADPATLGVAGRAVEGAVLLGAVALGGHHDAAAGVVRVGPLQQEDVGLLAGLEDAELGVDGAAGRHDPVGTRLGSAAQRVDVVPGGPALRVVVGVVVGLEVEDETRVDALGVPVSLRRGVEGHGCSG